MYLTLATFSYGHFLQLFSMHFTVLNVEEWPLSFPLLPFWRIFLMDFKTIVLLVVVMLNIPFSFSGYFYIVHEFCLS